MPLQPPASEPAEITVVESEACHLCADAQEALAAVATCYPLRVHTVDVRSDAGRALMARHRAPMSPLVLLDGAFFSSGRLPRRKLERVLEERSGHAPRAVPAAGGSGHG